MNKERIAKLLEEPARVAREDLAGLRELKERYPWFSGAHLLLAMGENATGEVLFDETLKTTAAHLPSRALLFDLVREETKRKAQEEQVVSQAPAPAPGPDPSPGPAPALALAPVAAPVADLAERILDQQMREAAASGVYQLEETDPTSKVGPTPATDALERIELTTAPASVTRSPRSFTDWLETAPVEMVSSVPFENEEVDPVGAQDWLRQASRKAPSSPELTRDLIDRFLQQSTPQPRKAEFFDPQQAGKRSLEERPDIVTETLARIHEKQGHWARAAAAYRLLAAKHPQKSGYFAALAKKAEEQLNH